MSRRPFKPRPSQSSLLPLWYSQQLSKNVMPASTAFCTMRTASSTLSTSPRWWPPMPRMETLTPVLPSGFCGICPAPVWVMGRGESAGIGASFVSAAVICAACAFAFAPAASPAPASAAAFRNRLRFTFMPSSAELFVSDIISRSLSVVAFNLFLLAFSALFVYYVFCRQIA